MLILLPPSEGKSEPVNPTPLSLDAISYAEELTQVRTAALAAAKVSMNEHGAGPAIEIYTGVLYKSLDWPTLPLAARKRGIKSIRIISSVYGVVTPSDLIAPYKMKFKAAQWKVLVGKILADRKDELIVDCRSSPYASAWTPPHEKTVAIRVFGDFDGTKKVITHMSKKYRGEVARRILLSPSVPKNIKELRNLLEGTYQCEVTEATEHSPHYLDLVIPNPYG